MYVCNYLQCVNDILFIAYIYSGTNAIRYILIFKEVKKRND